ncbi:MAG: FAD-binding protein [Candidatus Nanopelagicales bacterium]
MPEPQVNWAGNVVYAPTSVVAPRSVEELQELVASSSRIRALGTRHSFSTVADAPGVLVELGALPSSIELDEVAATVRVGAATRWGELAPVLHRAGWAVHTMGSLPHISVAGSASTGTHGSGDRHGCLASAVVALELVGPDGGLRRIARGDADFDGSVVALGALGVVTAVTLSVQPAYEVEQTVYDDLPFEVAVEELDAVMGSASSVSLFTRWRDDVEQVWVKRRTDEPAADLRWTGARPADGPRHPVPGADPAACTPQGGVPGPWFERVPHFRLEFTPSSGEELQSEYLVDREHARDALRAVHEVRDAVAPVLQIGEVRSVAADDLWLSMASGRDSLAIHFTWVADAEAVAPAVAAVERALAPFAPRPHWGKVFGIDPREVASTYPRFAEMVDLVHRTDPDGVLANDFVTRHLREVGD